MTDVPCLTTALTGPLAPIESICLAQQVRIESWFRDRWRDVMPPMTCSVDLRNAGFKLAPVDTNLYPAGFNNLNPDFLPLGIQAAQAAVEKRRPGCQRLLIIPESHTRNPFYWQSLARLYDMFSKAGYDVRIGFLADGLTAPRELPIENYGSITLYPVTRDGNRLQADNFDPCLILLNNDFSEGIPALLKNLAQPLYPPAEVSWEKRFKSGHFEIYDQLADQFAKHIDIDPWLINPYFRLCDQVDFQSGDGLGCLQSQVADLLEKIQQKYQAYQVQQKPVIFIKADAGTYGMGVMTVSDPNELTQLNRKQRAKMKATKGNRPITRVILQEGVPTSETWTDGETQAAAEPVIYQVGQYVIGGFYRIHEARGESDNLNAPGMAFKPLSFACPCNMPDQKLGLETEVNRFYTYGVIARLAALAAAYEIKGTRPC